VSDLPLEATPTPYCHFLQSVGLLTVWRTLELVRRSYMYCNRCWKNMLFCWVFILKNVKQQLCGCAQFYVLWRQRRPNILKFYSTNLTYMKYAFKYVLLQNECVTTTTTKTANTDDKIIIIIIIIIEEEPVNVSSNKRKLSYTICLQFVPDRINHLLTGPAH
jgi:hypothetical protein